MDFAASSDDHHTEALGNAVPRDGLPTSNMQAGATADAVFESLNEGPFENENRHSTWELGEMEDLNGVGIGAGVVVGGSNGSGGDASGGRRRRRADQGRDPPSGQQLVIGNIPVAELGANFGSSDTLVVPIPSLPASPLAMPLELAVVTPSLSANRPSIATTSPGMSGTYRPKGGYLYIRIIEAGNLNVLDQARPCGCGNASANWCCGVHGCWPICNLCMPSACCCMCECRPRTPTQYCITIQGPSLERTVSTTKLAHISNTTRAANFDEELLLRSLSFCGMEKVRCTLQTKSGVTIAEASMPIRAALPRPLARHSLDDDPAGVHAGASPKRRQDYSVGQQRGRSFELWPEGHGSRVDTRLAAASVAAAAVTATPPMDPSQWMPRQRLLLQPVGRGYSTTSTGRGPNANDAANPSVSQLPYLELEILQLADGALPRLCGTHPLRLAIDAKQEQLVRAYLMFDVAETLSPQQQSACIAQAIDKGCSGILVMLLDHIRPSHQHLLAAVHTQSPELVEAVLQAGGPAVLNPWFRSRQNDSSSNRRARLRASRSPSRSESTANGLDVDVVISSPFGFGLAATPDDATSSPQSAEQHMHSSAPPVPPRRKLLQSPQLTPLSLACSLGDVAVVETFCQWARRERVHLDPTAPFILGPEASAAGGLGGRGESSSAAAIAAASPWCDREELQRQSEGAVSCFADPPMIMAVRSRADIQVKLRLVELLHQYGFAVDVRSPVDSWTPLLAAVELGCLALVEELIKFGARLSAERHLGFTPLHVTCQMGHWHLIPLLTVTMCGQYARVAAWGPSPQYVSLNLVDAYGRTALDIALLRYFGHPLPAGLGEQPTGKALNHLGSEGQKSVDILREFVHRNPPKDAAGLVCGWELLRVLRFLEALPSRKVAGPHLWGADCEGSSLPREGVSADDDLQYFKCQPSSSSSSSHGAGLEDSWLYRDLEELLQAVRLLVQVGARTRKLPQDLVQPPATRGGSAGISIAAGGGAAGHPEGHAAAPGGGTASGGGGSFGCGSAIKDAVAMFGARMRPEKSPRYSPIETDDFDLESSADDGAL